MFILQHNIERDVTAVQEYHTALPLDPVKPELGGFPWRDPHQLTMYILDLKTAPSPTINTFFNDKRHNILATLLIALSNLF